MNIVCLDLEGVLVPEIWIAFSQASGIPELRRTTRDEPDYDKLMKWRIGILKEHGLGLNEIKQVIEKAKGGVLFIDEAYALTNRGSTDYGLEAVDTLLKAMEDHREDLVVIVAGYTELMKAFVHSNPGLESRFNRFMFFPDYTIDEMVGIFNMRCGKSGYTLAEGAEDTLREILEEESKDVESFGNARGVRNLFERAIAAQADRLAKGEEEINKDTLMSLKSEDLRAALEDKKAEAGEKEEETGKES